VQNPFRSLTHTLRSLTHLADLAPLTHSLTSLTHLADLTSLTSAHSLTLRSLTLTLRSLTHLADLAPLTHSLTSLTYLADLTSLTFAHSLTLTLTLRSLTSPRCRSSRSSAHLRSTPCNRGCLAPTPFHPASPSFTACAVDKPPLSAAALQW
jgi:hypothetical protein